MAFSLLIIIFMRKKNKRSNEVISFYCLFLVTCSFNEEVNENISIWNLFFNMEAIYQLSENAFSWKN